MTDQSIGPMDITTERATEELAPAVDERGHLNDPDPGKQVKAPPENHWPDEPRVDTDAGIGKAVDPQEPPLISFTVKFLDFAGRPLEGIRHKVQLMEGKTKIEFPGRSDAEGYGIKLVECIQPASPVELWVQRDDGSWVKKYQGVVSCKDMSICAVSPHIKIKVETELHAGIASSIQSRRPSRPATDPRLENAPNAPLRVTGKGAAPGITLTKTRDANGNPIAIAAQASADSNGRNRLPTFALWSWRDFLQEQTASSTTPPKRQVSGAGGLNDIKRVGELVQVMEQQATWDWTNLKKTYGSSLGVKNALANGSFQAPDGTKPPGVFHGKCYMSVKVGLWRAKMVDGVGGGEYPSTEARGWLLSQGFIDVTEQLPDARWAAPGDIVVYQYDDHTMADNESKIASQLDQYKRDVAAYAAKKDEYERLHLEWLQRKNQSMLTHAKPVNKDKTVGPEPLPPKPPSRPQGSNYGHIDVRTYDGYISDAKVCALPRSSGERGRKGFVVNGVFRRFFDALPEARMRAFLRVIREWECHEESDDSARYFLLNSSLNGSRRFSSTKDHPFVGIGGSNTSAGAYQIKLATYSSATSGASGASGIPVGFSPAIQDRIAVKLIEDRRALGLIRKGEVESAVQLLSNEWSSLPTGKEPRKKKANGALTPMTLSDLIERYEQFLKELIK